MRTDLAAYLGDEIMRSGTVPNALAQDAIRSEGKIEEPRLATYRETAAAIFQALAEAGLTPDPSSESPWGCEIELLEEYLDVVEQVPNTTMPKKQ